MTDFCMPALGADMEQGTLVEWLRHPGDAVKRGDIIAVVETQKGAIEVEIFQNGFVAELLVEPGETVPVGAPMARIEDTADTPAAPRQPSPEPPPRPSVVPEASKPPATKPPVVQPVSLLPLSTDRSTRQRISPLARKRAAELGVDVAMLSPSGPDNAIHLADVERARPSASKRGAVARGIDPGEMRRAIAAAMSRSNREIPHYHLATTIDLEMALSWLEERNSERSPAERILPAVLLLKATALALRKTPALNGFWIDDKAQPSDAIHIGWATALRGGGLMAPAIHDTDRKPLGDLMAAMRELVRRARAGGLRSSEMTDPTITVTNLGDLGAELVHGVIYPPQVALVGFGRVTAEPRAVGGAVQVRRVVHATLAADHRASDGMQGGRLLSAISDLLQAPEAL